MRRPSRADWFENRRHPQTRRSNNNKELDLPSLGGETYGGGDDFPGLGASSGMRRRNSYNPPGRNKSPMMGRSPLESPLKDRRGKAKAEKEVYNPFSYAEPPPIKASGMSKDDSLDSGDLYEDHWF